MMPANVSELASAKTDTAGMIGPLLVGLLQSREDRRLSGETAIDKPMGAIKMGAPARLGESSVCHNIKVEDFDRSLRPVISIALSVQQAGVCQYMRAVIVGQHRVSWRFFDHASSRNI